MEAPTFIQLGWPGLEGDGIADDGGEVVFVEPADGLFAPLHTDRYRVFLGTGFSGL